MRGVCDRLWASRALPRRVEAVAADLERPRLGRDCRDLADRCEVLIHAAASIRFDLPLAAARAINVAGAQRMIELARLATDRGLSPRLVHVSTAYVAGRSGGTVSEGPATARPEFRNSYERTKAEAERMVIDADLSAAIARPSIIVGESTTGWTSAFNVVYVPMRAFFAGGLSALPTAGEGLIDLVPVDCVVDGILRLAENPDLTGSFHLASGADAVTVRELSGLVAAEAGVDPVRFQPGGKSGLGEYTDYLEIECRFDTARAAALGVHVPSLEAYLPRILEFADRAEWGRHRIPRRLAAAPPIGAGRGRQRPRAGTALLAGRHG
jgi:nucleoside-diphosphate-sugar epimerase